MGHQGPHAPAFHALLYYLRSNTFSSGKPYERIDYIWVTPATGTRSPFMRCVAADLPNTQASDHFPLHATFELP